MCCVYRFTAFIKNNKMIPLPSPHYVCNIMKISCRSSKRDLKNENSYIFKQLYELFHHTWSDINVKVCVAAVPVVVNTLDARSRSTDFAQTSLRRHKSVDRWHGMSTPAPEVGRPTALYINARRQKSVDRLCFLMHTGTGMPES